MKKLMLFAVGLVLVASGMSAQDGQRMNAVKTDLFSAFIRTGVIKYERALNENMSVQVGFFYTGYHPRDSNSELNGWGVTPEFRYYLSDTPAPAGFYLAPNFRYMTLEVYDGDTEENGILTSLGLAVNLGKQWIFKDVVVVDAWLGPVYAFRSVNNETLDTGIQDADGFGIRLGIALGIAF